MIRSIENKFEIKLEFKKESKDPGRIFHSFGAMLDSIKNLDTLFADTINKQVSSSLILDDIEKGSIRAMLRAALVLDNDNVIDNTPDDLKIKGYLSKSRVEALDFLATGKSSTIDFLELQESLHKLAIEAQVEDSFNFNPLNPLKLAEAINDINEAVNQLDTGESYTLKEESTSVKNITPDTPLINIDEIETLLTDNTTTNIAEFIYLIKKPDFLGDSAWQFKHGKKPITAKILDENWLSNFKSGQTIVKPGDSLRVKVKQEYRYNRNGLLLSETLEILHVINVIHNN